MRISNQKGFTGFEIAAVLAIGFVFVTVVGPILKPLIPGLSNGNGQTSTQKSSYKETMEPVLTKDGSPMAVQTADGQEAYLFKRTKSNDASDEKVVPPAPWYERFVSWLAGLGFLGLVLALAFPGAAIAVWVFIKGRWHKLKEAAAANKAAEENMRIEAKRIVKSIDEGIGAFERQIAAAQAVMDGTIDPAIKATQAAVIAALIASQKSFMTAMSVKQDQSTKDLVKVLKI